MGLKILHSADWHLDSPFGGFPEAQRAFLKREQQKIPGKIADLCRHKGCDLMLLSGDIFDGEPTRETLDILKAELRHCGVPVLISPGNHDFCAPGSPWLEESWPMNVFIFTGGLESVTIQGLQCRIYGAAYQNMDCPGLLENFKVEGDERYKVAVLHGDPTQKNSPYCPITTQQVKQSGLDYLALGHIHKPGAFRAGRTLCAWPGCPMGRGWDETGDKGVCIVTVSEKGTQIQAYSLDTLRFHDLEVDISGDAAQALEDALPAAGNADFYRIALTGSGKVDIPQLLRRFDMFPNLELRDKTEEAVDLWADAGEDTLEGVYFQMLHRAMEEDPENAKRIQLAAEISRKLMRGKEVVL